MGRARALEVRLTADYYDAALPNATAGSTGRCLPMRSTSSSENLRNGSPRFRLQDTVRFKQRVNEISLASAEDFRRDSDLFRDSASL
jgi:hypothetical protein